MERSRRDGLHRYRSQLAASTLYYSSDHRCLHAFLSSHPSSSVAAWRAALPGWTDVTSGGFTKDSTAQATGAANGRRGCCIPMRREVAAAAMQMIQS